MTLRILTLSNVFYSGSDKVFVVNVSKKNLQMNVYEIEMFCRVGFRRRRNNRLHFRTDPIRDPKSIFPPFCH